MTQIEQQIIVGVLFSIAILIRLVAHSEAGGLFRDQRDGMQREGGIFFAIAIRLIFFISGLAATLLWITSPQSLPGNFILPSWAHWLGLILAELGIALLVWVHIALGVHFSGTLHLRNNHTLVQRGPYQRIRHPMYTAFLLLFGGLSLLTANILLASVYLSSQIWTILGRLGQEERSLEARFGEDYRRYKAQTGILTPWF